MTSDETENEEGTKQHLRIAEHEDTQPYKQRLAELFYPVYNRFYEPRNDRVKSTNRRLSAARISQTGEMFVSRALGYGIITGLTLWIMATLGTFLVLTFTGIDVSGMVGVGLQISDPVLLRWIDRIKVISIIIFSGILFGGLGFLIGFYSPYINMKMKTGSREREINQLLPDAISYMYALSLGGMNQMEIIETVASTEDVYGEVSGEFQTVLQESQYFDTDYRTALRHRTQETPSEPFAQFITDMLSILSSGGDLQSFLDDKTEKHLREAKAREEDLIEVIELFGEMYLNLSLLPLLLIILMTIMKIMGTSNDMMLNAVIYVLIPIIGVGFLVLMSAILPDEPGNGILRNEDAPDSVGVFNFEKVKKRKGLTPRFDRIYWKELGSRLKGYLKSPQKVFIKKPTYIFAITGPITLALLVSGVVLGWVTLSIDAVYSSMWPTVFLLYIPLYINGIPFMIFNRYNKKRTNAIAGKYTEALRKLSSANDTGQTLLESFMTVAETTTGALSDEFKAINAKVDYNYSLQRALTEFNNKYKIPEIARINNLIIDAQKTSSHISDVLITAAQTSENQDKVERERASRTRMQVVMVIITFFILSAVIVMLQDQFITVMGDMSTEMEGAGGGGGALSFGSIDPQKTGIKFFHAITVQGITAGLIASYLSSNTLRDSLKYILLMVTPLLGVWMVLL